MISQRLGRTFSTGVAAVLLATAFSITMSAPASAEEVPGSGGFSTQDLGGSTAKYVGRYLSPGICAVQVTNYASKNGYNWWHCEQVQVSGNRMWYGYVAKV